MPNDALNGFIQLMNEYGSSRIPFLFIIDYSLKRPEIHKLSDLPAGIMFKTPLLSVTTDGQIYAKPYSLQKEVVNYDIYLEAYRNVMANIRNGNSYLLNLTFPTKIITGLTLSEIFDISYAKYKLLYYNDFVVFSPETFVRIYDGIISSCPMKGTIDASIPDAEKILLTDAKETAEHNTIIDLIRNDLNIVAEGVSVSRYRYVETIRTGDRTLLQVSSEITGRLGKGYLSRLGKIITGMLPAGSVTGAPKKETLRIIEESEKYDRGWYTGVFGIFDGSSLDSAVLIRYIENRDGELFYKSGGGITSLSDPLKEYEELIAKIYVPVG
jgi:para-aminobenzoate synthetase component 1